MGRARRGGGSELPHAPLELVHPLQIPRAEIEGIRILREVPGPERVTLWELLWTVLAWSLDPSACVEVDRAGLEAREHELLTHPDREMGQPAGLLMSYMASCPNEVRAHEVAWAAVCVAEWASRHGYRSTAAQFAQAAALACGSSARYACITAELFRLAGESARAGHWFRRAARLAVWNADPTCQVRALAGLAGIASSRCCGERAARLRALAARIAKRNDLDLEHEDLAGIGEIMRSPS